MLRLAALAALCAASLFPVPLRAQEGFPHPAHARLFPLCEGCHAAALRAGAFMYPDAASCRNCHDGEQLSAVQWAPPVPGTSFDHVVHVRAVREAGQSLDCTDCHVRPGADRMTIGELHVGAACAGCHRAHVADSNCSLCHSPPPPAAHPLSAHAGCDGCHEQAGLDQLPRTRSFCLVCHVDLKAHAAPRACVDCHPVSGHTPQARLPTARPWNSWAKSRMAQG